MELQKMWGKVIGVVLLLVGVAGFFANGNLLGFGVNALHNVVHLLTGAVFAYGGFADGAPTEQINTWLGAVYILVAVVGFFGLLGFLNVNTADNFLHLAIGVVSLGIGIWAD